MHLALVQIFHFMRGVDSGVATTATHVGIYPELHNDLLSWYVLVFCQ